MTTIKLQLPLTTETILSLKIGRYLEISGEIYTARDQAHKNLCSTIRSGEKPPIPNGAILYYAGPTPPKPEEMIGACGPTTASRMDAFSPCLIENGFTISIGKGARGPEVINAIKKHNGLYLSALGGCGALYQRAIKKVECIAYQELLSEAIYQLTVKDFPCIVTVDSNGNSLF